MKILFVTGNENKLREARQILRAEIEQIKLDLPELQGDSQEVAREKAKEAARQTKKAVMIEDTSMGFEAWNGLPGPYIKFFWEKKPGEEFPSYLEGQSKKATVKTIIAFCEPGNEPLLFEGSVDGTVVPPRGVSRFTWDVCFEPNGHDKTYAELSPEEKNAISQRRKALEKFEEFLESRE